MRLLHTADWHLGRAFHGEDLLGAQAAAIDALVDLAASSRVDAVLVAGDVYDRALPPVGAVELASEALARLAEVAPVVVISGNHDSASRLGFGTRVFERAGLHVRTEVAGIGRPVLLGDLAVYPVPYLEPDAVREALGAGRGHEAVVTAAMDRARADLAGRPAGTRAVAVAHAFVAGGAESSSERDLAVGGAASVPPRAFTGMDYVALGHLHAPQSAGGARVRYAGSPLAYSFSEASHVKSATLVELGAAREAPGLEVVALPVPRGLRALHGTLAELLADPGLADAEGDWVQATLTDAERPADAMARLRRRFPHAVVLLFAPEGAESRAPTAYGSLSALGDEELVSRFVVDMRGGDGPREAELELLRDALAGARVTGAAA